MLAPLSPVWVVFAAGFFPACKPTWRQLSREEASGGTSLWDRAALCADSVLTRFLFFFRTAA